MTTNNKAYMKSVVKSMSSSSSKDDKIVHDCPPKFPTNINSPIHQSTLKKAFNTEGGLN